MKIEKMVLKNKVVRLEPIQIKHLGELCKIGLEASIWHWYPFALRNAQQMRHYIEDAIKQFELGNELAFVISDCARDKIVGSTRFMNIDIFNRRVEIGSTWLNPHWHRTAINTNTKHLMLMHAFEVWKCIRVELKTDALNEKSRNAILRIGAKQEGILRQHIITESGRFRDTVYFSILDSEWQNVKADLEKKLRSY